MQDLTLVPTSRQVRRVLRAGPGGRILTRVAWLHFGLVNNSRIFKRLEIAHFGCLGGPGGPGNPPERWGAKPPSFLEGLQSPRGFPDPKNDRFPILTKF